MMRCVLNSAKELTTMIVDMSFANKEVEFENRAAGIERRE
jgi:hypothetical protein